MDGDIHQSEIAPTRGTNAVIVDSLLALLMFCLPWSSDFDFILSGAISKIYSLVAVALILVWAFSSRQRWSAMPRAYLYFVVFVLFHNAITWFVLHPDELTWQAITVDQGVKISTKQASAVMLLRNSLSMILGFALATQIREIRQYTIMAFSLAFSLSLILVLGDVQSALAEGGRFVGGFSNPNAFADITVILGWLGLLVLLSKNRPASFVLLGGYTVVLAVVLLLLSASRGVIVAVFIGTVAYIILAKIKLNSRNLTVAALLLGGVLFLTPPQAFLQLASRSETVSSDNIRVFIWLNYLAHWKDYFFTGVGMGREMTLLSEGIKGGRIWNPHNTYLGQWVTMGICGIGLLAYMITSFWTALLERLKFQGSNPTSALMASALVVFAVMLFFGDRLNARSTWIILGTLGGYLDGFRGRKDALSC